MIPMIWRSIGRLTLGVDGRDAFCRADVPHPDRLVSRRGHKQVGVGRMPTQLVHTVPMASVVILLNLETQRRTSIGTNVRERYKQQ